MIAAGGGIGALVAARVQMTAMPQLVAILHSFVGLAAVLVGVSTTLNPSSTLIGVEARIHEVETFLGVFIGAVTFTGSIVALRKAPGRAQEQPLLLPGRHVLNLFGVAICVVPGHTVRRARGITAQCGRSSRAPRLRRSSASTW